MIAFLLFALWDHSYTVDIQAAYDDNVYAYSRSYIDDFLGSVRSYRFPFETYDDLVTSLDFALLVRNKLFLDRTTTFSFGIHTDNYLVNNQKSHQRYSIGARQSLGDFAVKLSYEWTPTYLIRYYRNPYGTSTEYIGCEVAYHDATAKVSYTTAQGITLHAAYGHRWDDYIDEFSRYDAQAHIVSFGIEKELHKRLDFAFGYDYRSSRADSADATTLDTAFTPDGSYDEHAIGADITFQTGALGATSITCSYAYAYRHYLSETADDILHFGRFDNIHRVRLSTRSRITTGVVFILSATRQWRSVTSEVFSDIDEIKDYTRYVAAAGLEFYY